MPRGVLARATNSPVAIALTAQRQFVAAAARMQRRRRHCDAPLLELRPVLAGVLCSCPAAASNPCPDALPSRGPVSPGPHRTHGGEHPGSAPLLCRVEVGGAAAGVREGLGLSAAGLQRLVSPMG